MFGIQTSNWDLNSIRIWKQSFDFDDKKIGHVNTLLAFAFPKVTFYYTWQLENENY